jgi:hypothetical protein
MPLWHMGHQVDLFFAFCVPGDTSAPCLLVAIGLRFHRFQAIVMPWGYK